MLPITTSLKRRCSWENDVMRQKKVLVTEKMVNSNNEEYMKNVYEKTNSLLFEGAKKAYNSDNNCQFDPSSNNNESSDYEMDQDMDSSETVPRDMIKPRGPGFINRKQRIVHMDRQCTSPYPDEATCSYVNHTLQCKGILSNYSFINNSFQEDTDPISPKIYRQLRLDKKWLMQDKNNDNNNSYNEDNQNN